MIFTVVAKYTSWKTEGSEIKNIKYQNHLDNLLKMLVHQDTKDE